MDISFNKKNSKMILNTTIISFLYLAFFNGLPDKLNFITYILLYLFQTYVIYTCSNKNFMNPKFLFFVFFSFFLGISPITLYLTTNTLYVYQLEIIIIAITFYIIGFLVKIKFKKIPKKTPEWNINKFKIIIYIFLIISLIANIIYFIKNRTLLFGGNMESGRIVAQSGNGLLLQMMNLSSIALCLLFEMVLNNKYNKLYFIILCCIFLPLTLVSGFRSSLIKPVLIMFLMYNKVHKIDNLKTIKFGICALLAIILLGVARSLLSSENSNVFSSLISTFNVGSNNFHLVYSMFGTSIDYQYGYSYLINIKMLLPGPDLDFTLWLKEILNISFEGGGLTPTIVGEFYLNFGIIGAYIGMFLIGIVMVLLEEKYKNDNKIFLPCFLIYIFLSSAGGGLANSQISLIFTLLEYYTINFIVLREWKLKWNLD